MDAEWQKIKDFILEEKTIYQHLKLQNNFGLTAFSVTSISVPKLCSMMKSWKIQTKESTLRPYYRPWQPASSGPASGTPRQI